MREWLSPFGVVTAGAFVSRILAALLLILSPLGFALFFGVEVEAASKSAETLGLIALVTTPIGI